MSYYIAFPIEQIGDDSVQAFMTIDTYHTTPPGLSRVILESYDTLEWSYNPEDRLMVPGKVTLHFKDLEHTLDSMLFGEELELSTTQKIKLEIRVNSNVDFIGYSLEDGIVSDYDQYSISITFAPELDKLNKRMILDQNGEPSNPFGYNFGVYEALTNILTDLFQTVNPAVTYSSGRIKIAHDWLFRGSIQETNQRDDIVLTELYVMAQYIYNEKANGLRTCGDVLRALATEFGCFAGMIHQEKGFFKQLYSYEPGNVQSVEVMTWSKGYSYGLLDYVKTTDAGDNVYEAGIFTELEDRFIERKLMLIFANTENPSIPYGNASWNVFGNKSGTYYSIRRVKDNSIGSDWLNFGKLTADWWYYWRNKISRTRVDKFTFNGIGYDFLKSFNHAGNKYQIFSMKKHLSEGFTEVEAFYLGAL